MKGTARILAALSLWLTATTVLNAQAHMWKVVDSVAHLIPTVGNRAIACADDRHCVVVSKRFPDSHDLIKGTTDGGQTWTVLYHAFLDWSGWFRDIAHPTPEIIVAVGDRGVINSMNGGATWTYATADALTQLIAIDMANDREGVTVSRWLPGVWKTVDGGATWALLPTPDSSMGFVDVSMPAPNVVIALMTQRSNDSPRATAIYRSDDGGLTYARLGELAAVGDLRTWLASIDFLDGSNGWAFGYRRIGARIEEATNVIKRTTDGGESWQTVLDTIEGVRPGGLSSGAFADAQHGVATGIAGTILRTTDGGVTWIRDTSELGDEGVQNLPSVSYPSPRRAFAACTHRAKVLRYESAASRIDGQGNRCAPLVRDSDDVLTLSFPCQHVVAFTVYDLLGRAVRPLRVRHDFDRITIDRAGLRRQPYFVEVQTRSGKQSIVLPVR